jgi:hypothetical protein
VPSRCQLDIEKPLLHPADGSLPGCLILLLPPRWALASIEHAKLADWPEMLLQHELGEAIELQGPGTQVGALGAGGGGDVPGPCQGGPALRLLLGVNATGHCLPVLLPCRASLSQSTAQPQC